MDSMRRAFVIFLILLFPLHVFAELVDRHLPQQTDVAERSSQAEMTSSEAGYFAIFGVAANYGHESDEPPASADLHDSLLQDMRPEVTVCLACSTPPYTPSSEYLLVLPLIKPPPLI